MATRIPEFEPKTYRQEWETEGTYWKQRAYACGQDATLSSADLQRGDALPDDSTYIIVDTKIDTNKLGTRFVLVTANKHLEES